MDWNNVKGKRINIDSSIVHKSSTELKQIKREIKVKRILKYELSKLNIKGKSVYGKWIDI